jgi:uncharacterized membrane protein YbhN (UPF0104 family)
MISRRILTPLSFVAGAGLFAALAYRFAAELPSSLGRFDPVYALLYLVAAGVVVTAHARRWQVVARALSASLPLMRLIAARLAGEAAAALVPSGKVFGDPVRIALVYGDGLPGPAAGAGVALDRLLEVIGNILAATVYVAVFMSFHRGSTGGPMVELLAALLLLLPALGLPVVLLWRGRRPLAPLYWLVQRRRGAGWRRAVAAARATEDQLLLFFTQHPRTFLAGIGVSLLIEGLVIIEYQFLLRAFGVSLPLPTLLMALVFSGLSRAVPTPVGLGALEASQVAALAMAGETAAAGFLVGLIMRLHETLLMAAGLGVCFARGLSFARLRLLTTAGKAVA